MEERELRERICDAAIDLGEQRGWDAVHMHDVAETLGITLAELGRHYAQKDDIAEAWFDRADAALLAAAESSGWQALAVRERLHRAIFAWLDTLTPHRRITGQMLRYKLQPEHLHLQALGLVRVSRTVQWIREVAQLPAVGWRREFEEVALTAIYLATFTRWLGDDSPGAQRSHAFLDELLARAERAAWRMPT
jgi:AcrR family transcriptional regulator